MDETDENLPRTFATSGSPFGREGYRTATPEDDTVSWGDWARSAGIGAVNVAAGAAATSEYLTGVGGETRQALNDVAEEQKEYLSPRARRALEAEWLPGEGDTSVWQEGAGRSLAMQTMAALPSLAASIVPGAAVATALRGASLGARVAGAGAGARAGAGVLAAGEVANSVYSAVDDMSDEELERESDLYAGYRASGASPEAARERLMEDMAGLRPVLVGALSAAIGGVEGHVAGRVAGAGGRGVFRGAGRGALHEAGQEAAEGGAGSYLTQDALYDVGLGDAADMQDVASEAVGGAVIGGVLGGFAGGAAGIGKRRGSPDNPAPPEETSPPMGGAEAGSEPPQPQAIAPTEASASPAAAEREKIDNTLTAAENAVLTAPKSKRPPRKRAIDPTAPAVTPEVTPPAATETITSVPDVGPTPEQQAAIAASSAAEATAFAEADRRLAALFGGDTAAVLQAAATTPPPPSPAPPISSPVAPAPPAPPAPLDPIAQELRAIDYDADPDPDGVWRGGDIDDPPSVPVQPPPLAAPPPVTPEVAGPRVLTDLGAEQALKKAREEQIAQLGKDQSEQKRHAGPRLKAKEAQRVVAGEAAAETIADTPEQYDTDRAARRRFQRFVEAAVAAPEAPDAPAWLADAREVMKIPPKSPKRAKGLKRVFDAFYAGNEAAKGEGKTRETEKERGVRTRDEKHIVDTAKAQSVLKSVRPPADAMGRVPTAKRKQAIETYVGELLAAAAKAELDIPDRAKAAKGGDAEAGVVTEAEETAASSPEMLHLMEARKLAAALRTGQSVSSSWLMKFVANDALIAGGAGDVVAETRRVEGSAGSKPVAPTGEDGTVLERADETEEAGKADAEPEANVATEKAEADESETLVDEVVEARERPKVELAEGEGFTAAEAKAPKKVEAVVKGRRKLDMGLTKPTGPISLKKKVEAAAAEVAPDPTDAQKEAGNYQKGHVSVQGVPVSIETAEGGTRSGVTPEGKPWSVVSPAHYGYIKRTTGADGEQIDVYIGPDVGSDTVFVIDQVHPARVSGFTTAKGSTYVAHEDGTTTRNKAERSDVGHEGDKGLKPRTAKTIYAKANASALSAAGMSLNTPEMGARVALKDGKATLLTWNPAAKTWGAAPSGRGVPYTTEPSLGAYPLELWTPANDVPGYDAYSRMHAGNKISEVLSDDPKFDEHKVVLGAKTAEQAAEIYDAGFSDGYGPTRRSAITAMTIPEFKRWAGSEPKARAGVMNPSDFDPSSAMAREMDDDELLSAIMGATATSGLVSPRTGVEVEPTERSTVGEMATYVRDRAASLSGQQRAFVNHVLKLLEARHASLPVYVLKNEDMVRFYDDGRWTQGELANFAGMHDPSIGAIVLRLDLFEDNADAAHVFVHELLHAAYADAIEASPALQRQITQIMDDAISQLPAGERLPYGLTDRHEFVSEAFSNPEFQRRLLGMRASQKTVDVVGMKGTLSSLWSAFVFSLRRALGIGPQFPLSLLDAAVRLGPRLETSAATARMTRSVARPAMLPTGVTEAVQDGWKTVPTRYREGFSKVMTLDQMRQFWRGAAVDKDGDILEAFTDAVQRITPFADRLRDQFERMGQRVIDYTRDEPQVMEEFAGVAEQLTMIDGNVVEGVAPSAIVADPSNKHLKREVQARALLPALQKRFMAMPPKARKMFLDMVELYRTNQNQLAREIATAILGTTDKTYTPAQVKQIVDATVAGKIDKAIEGVVDDPVVVKSLKGIRELRTVDGAYFPLLRHGEWVVTTEDDFDIPAGAKVVSKGKNGVTVEFRDADKKALNAKVEAFEASVRSKNDPTAVLYIHDRRTAEDTVTSTDHGKLVTVQTHGTYYFDSAQEAEAFRRVEGRRYSKVSRVMKRDQTGHSVGDLSSSQLAGLISAVSKKLDGTAQEGEKRLVKSVIEEAALQLMAGNRVQQRSLPRRRVQGASHDLTRNVLTYGEAHTRYRAKVRYAPDIREAMKRLRALQTAERYGPLADQRSMLINELSARVEGNITNVRQPHPALQNWMVLSYIDKLMSPAYSVINASQPIMVSMPVLGARHGIMAAGAALKSAYKAIGAGAAFGGGLRNTGTAAAGWSRTALNSTDILAGIRSKIAGEPDAAKLAELIDMMADRGAISPTAGFEIASVYQEGQGAVGTTIAKVDRIARQLPAAVEQVNRAVTGIAAYRLATRAGKPHPEAMNYAFDIVQTTQGDYSPVNSPVVFNHPIWRVSLQFKRYGQMMYALLGDALYRAFKNADPKERAVARKELTRIVGVQILVAGALGVPGLELVKIGFMAAAGLGLGGGYDDFERDVRAGLTELVGATAAELALKGVLTRAVGLDMSTRLGMDSLLTFGEPKKYEEESVSAWFLNLLGGAPTALLVDQAKALRALTEGDFLEAAQRVPLPKVVADTIKAADKAVYGTVSERTGKQTQPPIGLGTAALNAAGFRTAGQANASDKLGAQIAEKQAGDDRGREATKVRNEYAQARDEAGRLKALAKARTLNRTLPADEQLTRAKLDAFAKRYRKDEEKGLAKGAFRAKNKAERERLDQFDRIYGP
jgi:hypothetical protein